MNSNKTNSSLKIKPLINSNIMLLNMIHPGKYHSLEEMKYGLYQMKYKLMKFHKIKLSSDLSNYSNNYIYIYILYYDYFI